jgi:ABC-type uncharacterized transport system substrate-binding protein
LPVPILPQRQCEQNRTIPLVITQSGDFVSAGYAQSYARPRGNITGFMLFEATINTKYLQLLKDIAPNVTRVAVMQSQQSNWRGDFAAIAAVAQSFRVEPLARIVRNADDIERTIVEFARGPNGGLVVPPDQVVANHDELTIALAACAGSSGSKSQIHRSFSRRSGVRRSRPRGFVRWSPGLGLPPISVSRSIRTC